MRLLVATIVTWLALVASALAVSAPVINDSSNGTSSTGSPTTTQLVTLPATVGAGDLLIARLDTAVNSGGATGVTWPAGWTTFLTQVNGTRSSNYVYKTAIGTEGGTTITVTASSVASGIYVAWDITGWDSTVAPQGTIANGASSGSTVTPPAITPTWGAIATLFVTNAFAINTSGASPTGFPSGYTSNVINRTSGTRIMSSAAKTATEITETPGSFTGYSGLTASIGATFAVKPSTSAGTVINIPLMGM